ncbi:MAG: anti-sigma factor [Paracoccaceae bacterium]
MLEVAAEAPSAALFARIEAAIDAPASGKGAEITLLRRRLQRWKAATAFALAAAAALAIHIAVPLENPAARYVAVVTADDGGQAGLIVEFDTGTGVATVIPVTAPPPGNSYEMWTIPAGQTRPVSLGLLPQDAVLHSGLSPTPDQLFAISLEPQGGSPTGQPTQPLFHGRLVKVE